VATDDVPRLGPRHSPNTPEGELEGWGRFAAGLRRRDRRRLIAGFVVAMMVLPAVVVLIDLVLS
jgi:hypothetical protein